MNRVEDMPGVESAVTIDQPWASITLEGPRRFHNVESRPPEDLVGQRVAIYAAVKPDLEAADQAIHLLDCLGVTKVERLAWKTRMVMGAIIGTARVVRIVSESPNPWFVGPFALELVDTVVLPTPRPIRARSRAPIWKINAE